MRIPINKKIVLALTVIFFTILTGFTNRDVATAKLVQSRPAAPTNLQAVTLTDTSVTLSWSASKDKIKTYDIYCSKFGMIKIIIMKVTKLYLIHIHCIIY